MSLAELCRGPLAVGGHPHWKVISWRTFDASIEHRPASWVVTQDSDARVDSVELIVVMAALVVPSAVRVA